MEFEATIEYPVHDTNSQGDKEANKKLEQLESTNTDAVTNTEINDSAQNLTSIYWTIVLVWI